VIAPIPHQQPSLITRRSIFRGAAASLITACVVSLVTTVSPSAAAAMSKSLPPVDWPAEHVKPLLKVATAIDLLRRQLGISDAAFESDRRRALGGDGYKQ
jgi:hypothetical protein